MLTITRNSKHLCILLNQLRKVYFRIYIYRYNIIALNFFFKVIVTKHNIEYFSYPHYKNILLLNNNNIFVKYVYNTISDYHVPVQTVIKSIIVYKCNVIFYVWLRYCYDSSTYKNTSTSILYTFYLNYWILN